MTAVEWLAEQLIESHYSDVIDKAKEMEKEQKIELLKSLVYSVCIGDDVEDVEEWLKEHELNKQEQ